MKLLVNGEFKEFKKIETISQLLQELNVKTQFVAVELNGKIVYKEEFDKALLKDGDRVEVVSFVGGG